MAHYTPEQWTDYVRQNFKSVGDAERWRNANNVFVDDLPPPTYTGPLSTGGSAGELPPIAAQGTHTVDETEETPVGGLSLGYDNLGVPTRDQFASDARQITADLRTAQMRADTARQKFYDEDTAALKARRIGPSRAEQLFALAAAIGKPTLGRSFGEIMGNVTPALGDMLKAKREAETQREDAASALRRQMMLEGSNAELSNIDRRLKAQGLYATLLKPHVRRTGFNPLTGRLEYMDTGEPVGQSAAQLPVLTPEMAKELSANPSNRGMKFRTTDGRPLEIK